MMLDALDQLGNMNTCELETACLVGPKHRGGFRSSLNRLFQRKLVDANELQIWITAEGVHEVERVNLEIDRKNNRR